MYETPAAATATPDAIDWSAHEPRTTGEVISDAVGVLRRSFPVIFSLAVPFCAVDLLLREVSQSFLVRLGPVLLKPEGPGRAWSVEEVLALAARPDAEGLAKGRDFEHGKRTFAAARCIVCHRFGESGGATGPDLTQVAGRFQLKDLVEAIVHPSKVVSDQYKAIIVQTADGKVVSGRIVNESPEAITIVTDPEDATKFVTLARADIEEILPAPESLMPKGLLDQLNDREVLDLLAYTLSRDRPQDARFKKR